MIDDNKISEKSDRIMQEIYCVENIDLSDIYKILIPIIFDATMKHALYFEGKRGYKKLMPELIKEFYIEFDKYVKEKGEA